MKILKYLLFTLLYIIVLELAAIWIYIPEFLGLNYSSQYSLIQGLIVLFLTLCFFYFGYQKILKSLFNSPKIKWIIIAIIVGLSFIFIQTPLKVIYNFFMGTEYSIIYDFNGFELLNTLTVIDIIIIGPFAEELFFRGFIQKKMHEELKPVITILISALLFALIHSPYINLLQFFFDIELFYLEDWHLFYITFFGGLISSYLFYKSKSIIPSILFHICWNFMAVFA